MAVEEVGTVNFNLGFIGNRLYSSNDQRINWGQSAFALSCMGDQFKGFTEEPNSIAIYSNQDYANIPAGSPLNSLFEWNILDKTQNASWDWYSIDHLIQAMRSGNLISEDSYYESPYIYLRIENALKTQEPTRFIVELYMKNGMVRTTESSWFRIE